MGKQPMPAGLEERIQTLARWVFESERLVVFTGAGISTESGLPDFRGPDGVWTRRDKGLPPKPMELEWSEVQPNDAHKGMGELEKMGFLHTIITQNIDNLHQAGGSKNVIEYHGNSRTLSCLSCGASYSSREKRGEYPPSCHCKRILKPDVVFFGEAIPTDALRRSFQLAASAQALMVVGTSAVVSPANTIPLVAKENGAKVIEINEETTHLTASVTDIFIQGSASHVVKALVAAVKDLAGTGSCG